MRRVARSASSAAANVRIALLGHIDTFPGYPPLRRDGRLLYGRGAVDAKGPLCTFAAAARQAALPDDLRVVVIGAVEEEAATSKGARHALSCFQPDFCVIGEPSHWDRITLGYKGRLLLDWRWEGGLAHSAGDAPSPAERALAYFSAVKAQSDDHNRGINSIFARLDASLRDINTWQEGVNGVAEMTVGLRLPPGISPDALAQAASSGGRSVRQRSRRRKCIYRRPQQRAKPPISPRDTGGRRRPAIPVQNRHLGHECGRPTLELPNPGLRPGRFRARPYAR